MYSDVLMGYPNACYARSGKGQSANETTFDELQTVNNRLLTLSLLGFMKSLSVLITRNR